MKRPDWREILRWLPSPDERMWAAYVKPTYWHGLSSGTRLALIDCGWVLFCIACTLVNAFTDRFDFLTVWILALVTGWAAGMARSRRALAYRVGWSEGRAEFANELYELINADDRPYVTKTGRVLTNADIEAFAKDAEAGAQ